MRRSKAPMEAVLRNQSIALITHSRIRVCSAEQGKKLKKFLEPMITRAKQRSLQSFRHNLAILYNNKEATHLLQDIATKNMHRPGGYLRVIRIVTQNMKKMALVEIVERNKPYIIESSSVAAGA